MLKRDFIRYFVSSALAYLMLQTTKNALSQTIVLKEEDPDARALGYHTDSSRVNAEKYPTYKSNQHCETCAWYRSASNNAYGSCGMYSENTLVNSIGWCSAWMKKRD